MLLRAFRPQTTPGDKKVTDSERSASRMYRVTRRLMARSRRMTFLWRVGDAKNQRLLGFPLSALWILGQPVMFFDLGSALFHGWGIRFAPGGVVPGNRLKSVAAGLKGHGRFNRLTLRRVEGN